MNLLRKSIFGLLCGFLIFVVTFALLPFFKNPETILSLKIDLALQIGGISFFILIAAFCFTIFVSLSNDLKIVLPLSLLIALIPAILIQSSTGIVLSILIFIIFLLSSLLILNTLKTYLNFTPSSLFSSTVKNIAHLIIISLTIGFFMQYNQQLQKSGFTLPDQIIDDVLKLMPAQNLYGSSLPFESTSINQSQIQTITQNSQLLQQYGIDQQTINEVVSQYNSQNSNTNLESDLTTSLVKQTLQNTFNALPPSALTGIALLISLLFYGNLVFFLTIFSLLAPLFLNLTYMLLEKAGIIHFEKEMREVKKLVV